MTYMIYGATGYTGRLAIRFAVEAGEGPLLAGRNPEKIAAVAREFDLEWTAFSRPTNTKLASEFWKPMMTPSNCQVEKRISNACTALIYLMSY